MSANKNVVAARKKKGLTQEQLADLTNVTVRTIQRIESGESIPRSHTLKVIAAALDTSFEEINAAYSEAAPIDNAGTKPVRSYKNEDAKHFLQMLCLSCFSYLVIPLLHFLIPVYIIKKSKETNLAVIAFARKLISIQVYWIVSLNFLFLINLGYNIFRASYYNKTGILNYWWLFFTGYIVNAIIIIIHLSKINKVDPAVQNAPYHTDLQ